MALTPDSKPCDIMFCTNATGGGCEIAHLIRTQAAKPNTWTKAEWQGVVRNARNTSSCVDKRAVNTAVNEAKPTIVKRPFKLKLY